jgi:hypothetical protein
MAVDIEFEDGEDGSRVLEALSAIEWSRHQTVTNDGEDRVETVHWQTGRGIQFRAYDKGRERRRRGTTSDGPGDGELVRLERQYREDAQRQMSPQQWMDADWGSIFLKGFSAWDLDRLVVAGSWEDAVERIASFVEQDSLSVAKGKGLIGSLLLLAVEGEEAFDRRVARDMKSQLREAGLAHSRRIGSGAVPVGKVLGAARDVWRR